jgi:SAM-dependent methyltransferase
MFRALPDEDSYLRAGKSVARTISVATDLAGLSPQSILDYGCGHGRVLRWLQAFWPDARLAGADVTENQVSFCAATFGSDPVLIDKPFSEIALPSQYDLIWLGSIFTHMNEVGWRDLFKSLRSHVRPGGIICFSFAGQYVYRSLKEGNHWGFKPEDDLTDLINGYETSGFGFFRQTISNGQPWGRSLASPHWVLEFCLAQSERIVLYSEQSYARRQDVIALQFAK